MVAAFTWQLMGCLHPLSLCYNHILLNSTLKKSLGCEALSSPHAVLGTVRQAGEPAREENSRVVVEIQ